MLTKYLAMDCLEMKEGHSFEVLEVQVVALEVLVDPMDQEDQDVEGHVWEVTFDQLLDPLVQAVGPYQVHRDGT